MLCDGGEERLVRQFKIVVERHSDGFVAYPLDIHGIVVGQGDTYEEAMADVRSAIAFHLETFGPGVIESETPILEVFIAEAGVAV
jgi:predicted RNase H-like HicB family nuclease